MVDALGGRPGVYSARFSGPGATDETNNARLMEELAAVPAEQRIAAYVCSIALADPTGTIRLRSDGRCRGLIINEPRGENGFGYDPHFYLRDLDKTAAELEQGEKNLISHRGKAMRRLLAKLKEGA